MNIIIVDKAYDREEYPKSWEKTLQARGHHVDGGREITYITNGGGDLSKYHVAIAHPDPDDAKRLHEEIKRRKDFRVILTTGGVREPEIKNLRESSQVYYLFLIRTSDLINLVENGW